jgi:hypothetical protein
MTEMIESVARALCRQYELDDGFSVEQADRAAASEMYRNFRDSAHAAIEVVIAECARCVTNGWLDPLLSGPTKVGNLPARETEALLRGIQDRIRALAAVTSHQSTSKGE